MHEPRLKRLERLFADQPVYFITICTHDRKRLLDKIHVHEAFKSFAQQAPSHGTFVGNYVLMPDHLHLFAAFSSNAMLVSPWIKSLKNSLSKTLRQKEIRAPHWRKGFFDHVLRSRILRGKMGVHSPQSDACRLGQTSGRVAVPR
jgi:putative transposase